MKEAITTDSRTVLHVALYNRRLKFVMEIVKLMPIEALQLKETGLFGRTALHVAAVYGNNKAAELMVKKNPALTQIRDSRGRVPLELAIQHVTVGQKETVEYLYSVTRDEGQSPFSGSDGARLLFHAIDANLYDLALTLVERFPNLVIQETPERKLSGLEVMVQRPFAFLSGAKLTWWQRFIYSTIQLDNDSTYECITRGDEENPLERSKDPSAGGKEMMTKFILFHLISYLPQGVLLPFFYSSIRRSNMVSVVVAVSRLSPLYNQKLMHKQAFALVKYMVAELGKQMNRAELTSFFENSSVMKTAIQYGTTEFVEVCLRRYPILIWYEIEGQTMIKLAIGERNEKILNLIWEACCDEDMSDLVSRTGSSGSTMLHYAAKLAPSAHLNSVSGAALQMQRELQWFKGVETMVLEKDKFKRDKDGYTAQLIFTNEHKDLVEKGEKWMNVTSASCMLVGTLTATVAFAAAFTVPGGNLSDDKGGNKGIPVFLGKNSFMVFVAADALALFSSVTSVLMFLSILTSRYAEEDFLKSLPQKLILGLATLFLSLATLLIAFGASLVIVLGDQFAWAPILISLFGSVPVLLFLFLQFPLFVEMVFSTYSPSILRKQRFQIRKHKVKKEKEN
ncbi:hypothetical protein MKW92_050602 [Papaver armeniacum]|nr:hypothetical protein MKW92_050602 [Papaver armeniacum]